MAKHRVDIDKQVLVDVRAQLGVKTIKETVDADRGTTVKARMDALAGAELAPREQAWR